MVDKSGGDATQANAASQLSGLSQGLNSVGAGGAGVVEGAAGMASAMGAADQAIAQAQMQGNQAMTGSGGNDNISADTTINIA